MTKKEKAIQLIERIPEEKMDYILGVLEGAAIPMQTIPMPEITIENMDDFISVSDGASDDADMDALCEALEKMARMELHAYATGQK